MPDTAEVQYARPVLHLPLLRAGTPYRSRDVVVLSDVRTGAPVAEVSQANRGLIARDLAASPRARAALRERSLAELLAICSRAARLFAEAELPVDGTRQTPEQFVAAQSATTGMPRALCRANMVKVRTVLEEMEQVLAGLTRGLDARALDAGWATEDGRPVSFRCEADVLGAVLPSNSPGVHSLWLPAIALKVPLALRPGREEPWTPLRIAHALIAAGCPPQALGYYPSDYGGASEILLRCSRSMFFGDASTVRGWLDDPRVQIHGPGWSKVLFGRDAAERWHGHLDLLVGSVADNGGRSCLNASGVWTPAHGREIAAALAERLAAVGARPLDDPAAALCAFPRAAQARRVSEFIDRQLSIPGAEDLTAAHRPGRVAECDGCTFLLPTVIWCEDPAHPLAQCEFLFPFVSVVEAPAPEIAARIGPTLVATVLGDDAELRRAVLDARHVDRVNLGAWPTSRVAWDQPHEGNLFEHLYRRRALQTD
ncbi:MAG TPA: aldehyde dehydrogenase family protein [Candidatus Polarisedimenticolaceae bacterium]|nr:aldehyde dehydrogenase family protein [Candidatus Polarisedimenticolaceae bacterium]